MMDMFSILSIDYMSESVFFKTGDTIYVYLRSENVTVCKLYLNSKKKKKKTLKSNIHSNSCVWMWEAGEGRTTMKTGKRIVNGEEQFQKDFSECGMCHLPVPE